MSGKMYTLEYIHLHLRGRHRRFARSNQGVRVPTASVCPSLLVLATRRVRNLFDSFVQLRHTKMYKSLYAHLYCDDSRTPSEQKSYFSAGCCVRRALHIPFNKVTLGETGLFFTAGVEIVPQYTASSYLLFECLQLTIACHESLFRSLFGLLHHLLLVYLLLLASRVMRAN